ncbi:MAG TPA: M56 family metallopeptidase [Candidatus Acidoferrales bacterium]
MISSYTLKLLITCAASFFLIHCALSLATSAYSQVAIRRAVKMKPRLGARFLFFLRIFPASFALLAVSVLCVPSFFLFEPRTYVEHLNLTCFVIAIFGVLIWLISIGNSVYASINSWNFVRRVERVGQEICLAAESLPAWVLSKGPPTLALWGIIRPRLVLSRDVLLTLSMEELDVVLRHERAHQRFGDNLKRLLLRLAPDPFPFLRCFVRLDRSWAELSEWAADDEATRGDAQASVELAQALVRVARLGLMSPSRLAASLISDGSLEERVDRLLINPSREAKSSLRKFSSWPLVLLFMASLLFAVAILLESGPILHSIHLLIEQMIG